MTSYIPYAQYDQDKQERRIYVIISADCTATTTATATIATANSSRRRNSQPKGVVDRPIDYAVQIGQRVTIGQGNNHGTVIFQSPDIIRQFCKFVYRTYLEQL